MTQRGRPKLDEEERKRRNSMCRDWAAEIKLNSKLSAKHLASKLGYGSGNDDADGRAWRALASGSRAPSPENFRRMTALAAKNGWLDPLGWLRYKPYWEPSNEADDGVPYIDDESQWRTSTLAKTLLMLVSHARKCGVDNHRFFSEAHTELSRMESFLADFENDEIERRARRVAAITVQDLLDGPEYPTTSLGTLPGQ